MYTKYENICIRGFYQYTTLRFLSSKLFVSVHGMEYHSRICLLVRTIKISTARHTN
jgi:hypothetical protein